MQNSVQVLKELKNQIEKISSKNYTAESTAKKQYMKDEPDFNTSFDMNPT